MWAQIQHVALVEAFVCWQVLSSEAVLMHLFDYLESPGDRIASWRGGFGVFFLLTELMSTLPIVQNDSLLMGLELGLLPCRLPHRSCWSCAEQNIGLLSSTGEKKVLYAVG